MKQFSNVVAKIKNSDGKFESIPALRGMSSYEVAKAAGFAGTEEEWLTFMFDDGWVAKFQELETKKANSVDVYTKTETLSADVKTALGLTDNSTPSDAFDKLLTYNEPWNIDENLGPIALYPGHHEEGVSFDYESTTESFDADYREVLVETQMINSGDVYLSFKFKQIYTLTADSIDVIHNDNVIKSIQMATGYHEPTFVTTLLSVNKGDIVGIRIKVSPDTSKHAYQYDSIKIYDIQLFANIKTSFKYACLIPGLVMSGDEYGSLDGLKSITAYLRNIL